MHLPNCPAYPGCGYHDPRCTCLKYNCEECGDAGEIAVTYTREDGSERECREPCTACCPHDEHDHGICLDCGKDNYEDMAARAYDQAKEARYDD